MAKKTFTTRLAGFIDPSKRPIRDVSKWEYIEVESLTGMRPIIPRTSPKRKFMKPGEVSPSLQYAYDAAEKMRRIRDARKK